MEEFHTEKIMEEIRRDLRAQQHAAENLRFEDIPIPEETGESAARHRPAFAQVPAGAALVNVGAEDDPFERETFEKDVATADSEWRVSYFHPLPGGRVKSFFKRVVRKLIRSCIEPITQQISAFHGTVVYCLDALRRFVREQLRREETHQRELAELREQVAALRQRVEELEKDKA